jgi:glycosyltransferase involved in cell wall biosynthesis
MINPKISAIMPVYDTPGLYLRQAIESVLSQTYENFELIIVNDGSTDPDVDKIIKEYADKDNRIKYIYQENTGAAEARNAGIKAGSGEFVALMDSDDIAFPHRFARQVDFLDSNPQISVCGSSAIMFQEADRLLEYPENLHFLDFLRYNPIVNSTVMLRAADLERNGLSWFRTEYIPCEDYDLWARAARCLRFANIPEVLLKYRMRSSSVSHGGNERLSRRMDWRVKADILDFLTSNQRLQKALLNYNGTDVIRLPLLTIKRIDSRIRIYLFGFLKIFSMARKIKCDMQ